MAAYDFIDCSIFFKPATPRKPRANIPRCQHGNQQYRCTQCGYKRKPTASKDKPPRKHPPRKIPQCKHGHNKYRCMACGYTPKRCVHGYESRKCQICRHPPPEQIFQEQPQPPPRELDDLLDSGECLRLDD